MMRGMSSAEPFMPAHEPARELPPPEHDIDGDVDVLIEPPVEGQGELEIDHDVPPPSFRTPVPGAALADELAADTCD